jgi:hypothetical protein
MRKRPQLREILPIYPAMPFPPFTRIDRRSVSEETTRRVDLLAGKGGTQFREILCRVGNKLERLFHANAWNLTSCRSSVPFAL